MISAVIEVGLAVSIVIRSGSLCFSKFISIHQVVDSILCWAVNTDFFVIISGISPQLRVSWRDFSVIFRDLFVLPDCKMNRQKGSPLRVITYLVPGISVEYFEFIAHYLEDVLNLNSVLCYESRFCGPRKGQLDVFESNLADVGKLLLKQVARHWFNMFTSSSFYFWICISTASPRR